MSGVDVSGSSNQTFDAQALDLDAPAAVQALSDWLGQGILRDLHRRGAVVGCSGGIDSSVVLALCVRALGPQGVLAVLLPEHESGPESTVLAQELADQLGVQTVTEDISAALEGAGCYQRRDEAVRRIFPEFGPGWKSKITLPGSLLDQETLNVFYLTVVSPDGQERRERIPTREFFQIVAASNFKQRTRMAFLYFHAELRNYAVVGTANKNEHDLGFFVKYGDGGVDLSPILHLFKSQVYQLARVLDIPAAIQTRTPTSDTYSAGSTQEEFFFRLPFAVLDMVWAGYERKAPPAAIAAAAGLTVEQVERICDDISRKRRTTNYLRLPVLTASDISHTAVANQIE
jgi:NAD+ synthase